MIWKKENLGIFISLSHRERRNVFGFEGKSVDEINKTKPFDKASKSDIKKMFGLGLNSLINRLSLGISSINAENTSIKLKKEIQSIAGILFQQKIISKSQRKKILSLK